MSAPASDSTASAAAASNISTHWAATVCIHEPILLTNCADHSLLKSDSRIGAQPDPDDRASGDDVELRPLTGEARFHAEAACDAWTPC